MASIVFSSSFSISLSTWINKKRVENLHKKKTYCFSFFNPPASLSNQQPWTSSFFSSTLSRTAMDVRRLLLPCLHCCITQFLQLEAAAMASHLLQLDDDELVTHMDDDQLQPPLLLLVRLQSAIPATSSSLFSHGRPPFLLCLILLPVTMAGYDKLHRTIVPHLLEPHFRSTREESSVRSSFVQE